MDGIFYHNPTLQTVLDTVEEQDCQVIEEEKCESKYETLLEKKCETVYDTINEKKCELKYETVCDTVYR